MRCYRDVLGLRLSDYIRTAAFLHCNPRDHSPAIGQGPRPKRMWHVMLQVQTIDDAGSTYFLCQEQGVPISVSLGRHANDRMLSFYLTTPFGIDIEYGWGGRVVDDATWQVIYHEKGTLWGHKRIGQSVAAPQPAAAAAGD